VDFALSEEQEELRGLAARILEEEHQAYPEALRRLLTESWEVLRRRLVFSGGADGADRG